MRIAAQIAYDGHAYCGWQKQQTGIETVQNSVEIALSKLANDKINVYCAGRTDTGVHATGQIIHFDTSAIRRERDWVMGGNYYLPADIRVIWAQTVDATFHARFSALSRHYQYAIFNRNIPSPLHRTYHTWVNQQLCAEDMQQAGQYLLGEHDFSAYRGSHCQSRTPYREITQLTVTRTQNIVTINIIANAFLHHMVRNIAGVLIKIGSGDKPIEWANTVLQTKDRAQAAVTSPPTGLTLVSVNYPEHFNLPI